MISAEIKEHILDLARSGDLENFRAQIVQYYPITGYDAGLPEQVAVRNLLNILTTEDGITTLHYAAANNHTDLVRFIVSYIEKQEVDRQNLEGSTALHWAALTGSLESVKILLEANASPKIKDSSGRSPITLAERQNHEEVVIELMKYFEPEQNHEEYISEDTVACDN